MQLHIFFFLLLRPLGHWGGAKRSNISKSQLQSLFQRFINQTLCVFSQRKDIEQLRQDFHSVPESCPRVWDLGVGGQNFNFLNMIMWHIKLKLMSSRPGHIENLYPTIKLVTFGWGQRVNTNVPLDFFESVGICDGASSNVF